MVPEFYIPNMITLPCQEGKTKQNKTQNNQMTGRMRRRRGKRDSVVFPAQLLDQLTVGCLYKVKPKNYKGILQGIQIHKFIQCRAGAKGERMLSVFASMNVFL